MKEQPEYIGNVKVVQKVKYLGIEIENKNYLKSQRDKIIQKAWNMTNITYSVIEKSYTKLLIGKTFWDSSAFSSLWYQYNTFNRG